MRTSQSPGAFRVAATKFCLAAGFALAAAAAVVYFLHFTPQKCIVRHRLSEADAKATSAIGRRLDPVRKVFEGGRRGAGDFAKEVMSFSGKWAFVKGLVVDDSHRDFTADAFARHVFDPDALGSAIEAACTAYAADLEGYEAEMLVLLRADLADIGGGYRPKDFKAGDDAFRREFKSLAGRLAVESGADLAVFGVREVGTIAVTEVATRVAVQAGRTVAAQMGVRGGILSTGAGSFAATMGVGLVISLIVDYVLDVVLKAAGYDPEEMIAKAVVESLDRMEAALVGSGDFGNPRGSLRVEMEKMRDGRSRLRRLAIDRMVSEGGVK